MISNEEFIQSGNVLNEDNIERFRKEFNNKMKLVFGVNNWINYYENEHSCKLEDFIGKSMQEIYGMYSHIDRD